MGKIHGTCIDLGIADTAVTLITNGDDKKKGEKILIYGIRITDDRGKEIRSLIAKKTGLRVRLVNSVSRHADEILKDRPRLVVIVAKEKISKVVADLKSLKLGYDVEIHLRDSNINYQVQDVFYVRVKLLEREIEHAEKIIAKLTGLGIDRKAIWVSIIEDFIPGDKMM